jgi:mRNA interferase MazF
MEDEMKIQQYHIYVVNLDPTIGAEIKKMRPCLVITPDEMNNNLDTVMVVPITSTTRNQNEYPTRMYIENSYCKGYLVIDQIRTIDKSRFYKNCGTLCTDEITKLKKIIEEMLVL